MNDEPDGAEEHERGAAVERPQDRGRERARPARAHLGQRRGLDLAAVAAQPCRALAVEHRGEVVAEARAGERRRDDLGQRRDRRCCRSPARARARSSGRRSSRRSARRRRCGARAAPRAAARRRRARRPRRRRRRARAPRAAPRRRGPRAARRRRRTPRAPRTSRPSGHRRPAGGCVAAAWWRNLPALALRIIPRRDAPGRLSYGVFSPAGERRARRRAPGRPRARPRRARARRPARPVPRRRRGVRRARCSTRSWRPAAARGTRPASSSRRCAGDARAERHAHALADVVPRLPFTVADYADFYASLEHATNLGRMLRPGGEPLLPNWRQLPVGYHGRAGTVVVSGTDVVRPCGQYLPAGGPSPRFGPSAAARHRARARLRRRRRRAALGEPRRRSNAALEHVFGVGPAQRLERARPAGLGVPAAGPVPRQVVRDLDLRLGDAARRARAAAGGGAGAGARAAALPARAAVGATTSRSRSSSTARASRARAPATCTGRRRR